MSKENTKYITPEKQYDVVSFLRKNFPDLTDSIPNTENGNKQVYDMAPDFFPSYVFSDWDDGENFKDYPSDPNRVDTSPKAVNSITDTSSQALRYLNKVPVAMQEKHRKRNPDVWHQLDVDLFGSLTFGGMGTKVKEYGP